MIDRFVDQRSVVWWHMFDVADEAEVRYVQTWTTKRILALMTVTMIVVVEIPKVDDEMVCLLDSSAAACCDLH